MVNSELALGWRVLHSLASKDFEGQVRAVEDDERGLEVNEH